MTGQYYAAVEAGREPSVSWLYEFDRLRSLQVQTEKEIQKFAQYAEGAIRIEQREAAAAARRDAVSLMQASFPEGVSIAFDRLPKDAFVDLVGFLQDGSPLKDLLNELPLQAGKVVADGLQAGLLLGWNPKKIAGSIREALGGNLARALRIARTETLRSYREATRRMYQANSDVLEGWIWRSARNERTCAMCWAMDGTVHGFEEQLNDHICGRCAMAPKAKSWRDLGFDIDEIESGQPGTGVEAFGKLSDSDQLKILGPAKYAAYKDGVINLSDLVGEKQDARWGSMRYEKSLKEVIGEGKAKDYTRLALMGVAKNAGKYSADDLIRVAGIGTRNLSTQELQKVVNYVANAGFSQTDYEKVKSPISGLVWNGNSLQAGSIINTGTGHYIKHVIVKSEWPIGTSELEYYQSLKEVILNSSSRIFVAKFSGSWQIGFIGSSGKWQGAKGFSDILVEYKVDYGHWVTGFQPSDLLKQITNHPNRKSLKWIR